MGGSNPVQWSELVQVLQYIAGAIGILVLAVGGAAISGMITGSRWVGRIETSIEHMSKTLERVDRRNSKAHETIWVAIRRICGQDAPQRLHEDEDENED